MSKNEESITSKEGGMKANKGKTIWSLVPFKALERAVKVLEHGAIKYAPGNWKKVDKADYIDAAFRHLTAFVCGETKDSDTGYSHLDHALCNLLFLTVLYGDDGFEPHNKEHIEELLGLSDCARKTWHMGFDRSCTVFSNQEQKNCRYYAESKSGNCQWLNTGHDCCYLIKESVPITENKVIGAVMFREKVEDGYLCRACYSPPEQQDCYGYRLGLKPNVECFWLCHGNKCGCSIGL